MSTRQSKTKSTVKLVGLSTEWVDITLSETGTSDEVTTSALPLVSSSLLFTPLATYDTLSAVGTGGTGVIGLHERIELTMLNPILAPQIAAVGTGGTGTITPIVPRELAAVGMGGTGNNPTPSEYKLPLPTNVSDPTEIASSPASNTENLYGTAPQDHANDLPHKNPSDFLSASQPNTIKNSITQVVSQHAQAERTEIPQAGYSPDATPTLFGTAATNSLWVHIYDNDTLLGTSDVQPDGMWQFTPDQPLLNGMHHFYITTTDIYGQTNSSSNMWHIQIDTLNTAPINNPPHTVPDSGIEFEPNALSISTLSITPAEITPYCSSAQTGQFSTTLAHETSSVYSTTATVWHEQVWSEISIGTINHTSVIPLPLINH